MSEGVEGFRLIEKSTAVNVVMACLLYSYRNLKIFFSIFFSIAICSFLQRIEFF